MSLANVLTHSVDVVTKVVGKTVIAQAAGYFNTLLASAQEGGRAFKFPMPVNLATFFGVPLETDVITPIFINKPLVTESWGRSLGIQDLSSTEDGYFIYLKRNGAFLLKTDGFPVTFNGEVYLPNEANMIALEVTDKYNVLQVNNKTLFVVVENQEVSIVHHGRSTTPRVLPPEALQQNELAVHPDDVFQVGQVCVGMIHGSEGLETFVVSGILPKQVGTHILYLSALTLDPEAIDPPITFRVDTSADELRYASALAFHGINSSIVAIPADSSKFIGRVEGAEPLIRIYAKPLNKQFDLFLCLDKVGSFLKVTDVFGSETSIPVLNNLGGVWQPVSVDVGLPQVVRAGKHKSEYGLRLVGEFNYEEYVLHPADGVLDFSKVDGGLYKAYIYQNNVWVLNGYIFVYHPTTIQIEPFCTVTGRVSDSVSFNGEYLPNHSVALHKSVVLDVSYVIDQSYNKPSVWAAREAPMPYTRPLNTQAITKPSEDLEELVAKESALNKQRMVERVKVASTDTFFVEKHHIPYVTEDRTTYIDVDIMNARQVKLDVGSDDERFIGFVVGRAREGSKCYEFYDDFAFVPPAKYEVIAVFSDTSFNLGNVDLRYNVKFEAEFPSGSVSMIEPPEVPVSTLVWKTHEPRVTINGEGFAGYGVHYVSTEAVGNPRLEGKSTKLKMVFEPIFGEEYVIFNHVADTTEVSTNNKGKTLSLNGKSGKLALKDSGIHAVTVGAHSYKPSEVSFYTSNDIDANGVLYGKERGFYVGGITEDTVGVVIERPTKGKLKVYDVMPVRAPSKEKLSFVEIKVIKDGVVCTPLNRPTTGDTVTVKVFAPFGNTVFLTTLVAKSGGSYLPMGKRILPYNAKEGCYEDVILYKNNVTDLMVEQGEVALAAMDIVEPHFIVVDKPLSKQ
jgi:hypothetical protein